MASAAPAPAVMVNSCTGKMGNAVAEAVLRAGLPFVPMTITGESRAVAQRQKGMAVGRKKTFVEFIGIEDREHRLLLLKQQYPHLIIVDFTLPSCVNENAMLYGELGLNFVMGTTGGDREKLMKDVHASGVYAVIAPQMGKQIVAFQAMLKYMSDRFPGAFSGYTLSVTESHQSSKVDTSGTAKAVIQSFQTLGTQMDEKGITMIRDPDIQLKLGVPKDALTGHAYHTYHLSSPDKTVSFEFQHNVAGASDLHGP